MMGLDGDPAGMDIKEVMDLYECEVPQKSTPATSISPLFPSSCLGTHSTPSSAWPLMADSSFLFPGGPSQ